MVKNLNISPVKFVFDNVNTYPLFISAIFKWFGRFVYTRKCDRSKTISDELENKLNIYLKLFVILYTNDTVLMAESDCELQT